MDFFLNSASGLPFWGSKKTSLGWWKLCLHKIYVGVPTGSSTYSDTLPIIDLLFAKNNPMISIAFDCTLQFIILFNKTIPLSELNTYINACTNGIQLNCFHVWGAVTPNKKCILIKPTAYTLYYVSTILSDLQHSHEIYGWKYKHMKYMGENVWGNMLFLW